MVEAYAIAGLGHGTPIASRSGEEAVGTPGPFILEAGISSSERIAAFWGLTGTVVERAQARPAAGEARPAATGGGFVLVEGTGPTRPQAPASARPETGPGRRGKLDPATVIAQALKAAGLIKH